MTSCPSNDETRNTSKSSEASHQSTYQKLYYMCVFLLADEEDLQDVTPALADFAGRWRDLGDSLRIRCGDLDAISSSAHSPSDCLRDVLIKWLRQNYKVWFSHIPGLCTFFLQTLLSGLVTRGQIKFFNFNQFKGLTLTPQSTNISLS